MFDNTPFEAAMLAHGDRAKAEVHYNPTRMFAMIAEHGGVATARRLLNDSVPSEGFTNMVLLQRIDLTVEALVLQPEWRELFTLAQLQTAATRCGMAL